MSLTFLIFTEQQLTIVTLNFRGEFDTVSDGDSVIIYLTVS